MSTSAKKIDPLTSEETMLVSMYRNLDRWDRNGIFVVLQSLSRGRLTSATDHWSWDRLRRSLGLQKVDKGAFNG